MSLSFAVAAPEPWATLWPFLCAAALGYVLLQLVGFREAVAAVGVRLELAAQVAALRAGGADVISLSIGEPHFKSPPEALDSATEFIGHGHIGYTAGAGRADLRAAAAGFLQRQCGVAFDPADVVVTNGAKEGLTCAILALAGPGDEVLCPAPAWMSYAPMCTIAGARLVEVPCDPARGFLPRAEDIAAALTPATRVLLLNSPNNPTGAVYDSATLGALAAVLAGRPDIAVISDEIYSPFVYAGRHVSPATLPGLAERTVIVHGLSKGYAMTGWRIGFVAAPRAVAASIGALKSQMSSSACAVSQQAGVAALAGGDVWAVAMRSAYAARRLQALAAVAALPGVVLQAEPQGAFYVFPRVDAVFGPGCAGSVEFCAQLLAEEGLALVPGGYFGEDRCVRLSYAAGEDTLTAGLARLSRFVQRRFTPPRPSRPVPS